MKNISSYILENSSGIRVCLSPMGASIQSVKMGGLSGIFTDVALPQASPPDDSYAGCTLAPYAGRIAGGMLRIDGKLHSLCPNEGENQLHGGMHNLSRRLWQSEPLIAKGGTQSIAFHAALAHDVDGFPGNREFTAGYTLCDNRLDIHLEAITDRPSRVNLSNHTYWNLSGDFTRDAGDHLLWIASDEVYVNNQQQLVIGKWDTADSCFDFRALREIGSPHAMGHPQLRLALGYNHCFVMRPQRPDEPSAMLMHPASGRRLRLFTDQPCMVVYSGGYLHPSNCAVALEPQEHPYAPAIAEQPDLIFDPEHPYRRHIAFVLDTMPT